MPLLHAKDPTCQCCGTELEAEQNQLCTGCATAGCDADSSPCMKPMVGGTVGDL